MKKVKICLFILLLAIPMFLPIRNVFSINSSPLMIYEKSSSETLNMTPIYKLDDFIFSMYVYNNKLYAGEFGRPGTKLLTYNGTEWNLNHIFDPEWQIWDMVEYNGKLFIAFGAYTGRIYVYESNNGWNLAFDPPENTINCLGIYNGKLYAGTGWSMYGGIYGGAIYEYNGSDWKLIHKIPGNHIKSFVEYEGKLYVGTEYANSGPAIWVYDGENWEMSWSSDTVYGVPSLIVFDDRIYAACYSPLTFLGSILVYDGTWSTSIETYNQSFYCLISHNNRLYAGTLVEYYSNNFARIYTLDETGWNIAYDFTIEDKKDVFGMAIYENKLYASVGNRIYVSNELKIPIIIETEPETLELRSSGKWITVYIELPEGFNLHEIDITTLLLQEEIPAESSPVEIGDFDYDGIPDLMVKFDRASFESLVSVDEHIEVTLSGSFFDGLSFFGIDVIRVIS
ncbi:MAG: hypothetical protein ACFFD2_28530 [Promethearchaeota archaeon]